MLPEAIDSDTVAAGAHFAHVKSVICSDELAAIEAKFATSASFDPEKRRRFLEAITPNQKKLDHDPTI
jgi:hypothetical protein